MKVDPAASQRCWAIDVELGGRVFTIPPKPAADWWPVIVGGDMNSLLELLPGEADDLLLDGGISLAEQEQVLIDAMEAVCGRPHLAAMVLATFADAHWPVIGGQLAQRGFRWDAMPIAAALDAIYYLALKALPEKAEKGKGESPRDLFLRLLETGGQKDDKRMVADFEATAGPRPAPRKAGSSAVAAESSGGRYAGERPKTRRRQEPRLPAGRSESPT